MVHLQNKDLFLWTKSESLVVFTTNSKYHTKSHPRKSLIYEGFLRLKIKLDFAIGSVYYNSIVKRKRENMTETIFIDAIEGAKVAVFKGAGNQIGAATTPKMLAYILDTHKIFGEVMFCSTMDFATEAGFADDGDAKKLFDNAVAMRG